MEKSLEGWVVVEGHVVGRSLRINSREATVNFEVLVGSLMDFGELFGFIFDLKTGIER